jgi:hypothetical protein
VRVCALAAAALAAAAILLVGCGSSGSGQTRAGIPSALLAQARPIGRGARFHPPVHDTVIGPCSPALGAREGVHVEVFAQNRVLLLAAGIGTLPPRTLHDGHIASARCYGALVTLDATGLVLVRDGTKLDAADLFRSWGQPLSPVRLTSFRAPTGTEVTVFVDGRRWYGAPGSVPLARHAEIVLEVGPHVPPHASYRFPPGT